MTSVARSLTILVCLFIALISWVLDLLRQAIISIIFFLCGRIGCQIPTYSVAYPSVQLVASIRVPIMLHISCNKIVVALPYKTAKSTTCSKNGSYRGLSYALRFSFAIKMHLRACCNATRLLEHTLDLSATTIRINEFWCPFAIEPYKMIFHKNLVFYRRKGKLWSSGSSGWNFNQDLNIYSFINIVLAHLHITRSRSCRSRKKFSKLGNPSNVYEDMLIKQHECKYLVFFIKHFCWHYRPPGSKQRKERKSLRRSINLPVNQHELSNQTMNAYFLVLLWIKNANIFLYFMDPGMRIWSC